MKYYNKLTQNRKAFINQLYNLVFNQFEAQNNILGNEKEIMEELENNPDFIQRIFIDASWGMGKTYFADSLVELVKDRNNNILEEEKKLEILRINAWESDYFADPMKSLIGELNEYRLINSETTEKAKEFLKGVGKELGIKLLKNLVLKKFNFTDDDISKIKEFFTGINESGLEEYKKYKNLVFNFKESLSLDKKRKIILIDELDRCRPNYAIELLETVKHIFGVKNIIFIFLVNKSQLKSTASTMYFQEDRGGEYFEKFFDIQFRLPKIDYYDFIKLEYEKYKKLDSYNVKNGISNNRDLYLESLFLDVFESKYDYNLETTFSKNELPSVRLFIKAFKKYKLLLKSLSNLEKKHYPAMILLVIYFLEKEFLWKESYENRMLTFLKTFFWLRNLRKSYFVCHPEMIFDNYRIKEEYTLSKDFYADFYKILFYGKNYNNEEKVENNKEISEIPLVMRLEFDPDNILDVSIEDHEFKIDNLNTCMYNDNKGEKKLLSLNINNLKLRLKYTIPEERNRNVNNNSCNYIDNLTHYHINVLYEWCEEKYSFIL